MMLCSPNGEAFRIACIGHEIAHIRSLQACGFDMSLVRHVACVWNHSTQPKYKSPAGVCTSHMFKITDFVHCNRLVVISRKHFTFTDRHYTTSLDNSGCQHCEIFMNVYDSTFDFFIKQLFHLRHLFTQLSWVLVFIIVGNNICINKC